MKQKVCDIFNDVIEWVSQAKSIQAWLTKNVLGILSGSLMFTLFSLLLLRLTPEKYMAASVDIISESIGINSFFITFCLTIFIMPLFLWFIGPRVTDECKESLDKWLDNKYSSILEEDELVKRKEKFIKINKFGYKYIFLPIHNFNVSFGTGSLGVMLAFIVYQKESASFTQLSAFSMLFAFIFISKLVAHISILSVGKKNFEGNINFYRWTVTIAALVFSIVAAIEIDKILEKRTDALNKAKLKAEQCIIQKDD
jgi:hypothetical protein